MRGFAFKSLILLLTVSLFACQVQKRKYQRGFYVERVHRSGGTAHDASVVTKTNRFIKHEIPALKTSNDHLHEAPATVEEYKSTSDQSVASGVTVTKKNHCRILPPDSCDLLVFKDGSELKVKVAEINVTDIKYRRCDNKQGPVYLVRKSLVFKVIYSNGSSELIKGEAEPVTTSVEEPVRRPRRSDRQMHPLAPYSLAMAIGSFLLTCYDFAIRDTSTGPIPPIHLGALLISSMLAVILGRLALNDMKARPGKYNGRHLAAIGSLIGIIILGMFALMALFFVLLP